MVRIWSNQICSCFSNPQRSNKRYNSVLQCITYYSLNTQNLQCARMCADVVNHTAGISPCSSLCAVNNDWKKKFLDFHNREPQPSPPMYSVSCHILILFLILFLFPSYILVFLILLYTHIYFLTISQLLTNSIAELSLSFCTNNCNINIRCYVQLTKC